jgi:hypothetical protein
MRTLNGFYLKLEATKVAPGTAISGYPTPWEKVCVPVVHLWFPHFRDAVQSLKLAGT